MITIRKRWCVSEKIDELKESFFHLAYSILNNADDAEEAVAEAIFRMWRSRDSLRNQDRMESWMYAIVRNTAKLFRRKRRRQIPLESCVDIPAESEDVGENIWSLLEYLNEKLRLVMYLYYYTGLTQKEIARILEIGVPLVKYRVRRARELLKAYLGEEGQK